MLHIVVVHITQILTCWSNECSCIYLFLPHSHAHHTPMPIVLPRPHVSPAHQGTTVVTQPPILFPLPAPTPALIFVPLGLHVVMAALSNHAPRGNTHLKDSGHARHVQRGSAVPIHLHPQFPSSQLPPPLPRSPPSQLPPPLPLTVLQKLNLQPQKPKKVPFIK